MKKTLKKLGYYVVFLVISFLFVVKGSQWIANSLTQKFENQISSVLLDQRSLKKYCANRTTYDSLKVTKQPKVELLAGDQGGENIIYFPTKINGHTYEVDFQSNSNSWNRYYGAVKLKQIRKL